MKILTEAIKRKLIMNWHANHDEKGVSYDKTVDPKPPLKLFNPVGSGTWLISELDPRDGDTMFGLADPGLGSPELGYMSLSEMMGVRLPFGLRIERDLNFTPKKTLSEYADEASNEGRIFA